MAVDVELLRKNFFDIAPKVEELTETFYATLFLRYPEVVPLFDGVNMQQQRRMLANALVFVVENLDAMDIAKGTLEEMGRRHLDYGALAEHYPAVGESLVHALATVSGDLWNDTLETQWVEAFGIVSSIMIEGAEKAAEASAAK